MAKYKNLTYTELGPYKGTGDNVPDRPNTNVLEQARRRINPGTVLDTVEINGEITRREMRVREVDANGCPCGPEIVVPEKTVLALP